MKVTHTKNTKLHSKRPPKPDPPHPMPLFAFAKERFDPDFALVHGFLVSQGRVVLLHALLIIGKKGTMQVPTTVAWSTVQFHGASITGACNCTIFNELGLLFSVKSKQHLPLRAAILIMDSIIGELTGPILRCLVFPIGQGD